MMSSHSMSNMYLGISNRARQQSCTQPSLLVCHVTTQTFQPWIACTTTAQDGVDMTLMGHDTKASDLFVAALENEGVTLIFALPGNV